MFTNFTKICHYYLELMLSAIDQKNESPPFVIYWKKHSKNRARNGHPSKSQKSPNSTVIWKNSPVARNKSFVLRDKQDFRQNCADLRQRKKHCVSQRCAVRRAGVCRILTSTPVTPSAVSIFCVILNGTFSGTRRLRPFSKHTL